ncbi:MAG: tRNA lysidine(34) synthetase TilS [Vicingaceae bacterium]
MLEKFQKYFQENKLFIQTDKVLLTVSGGKDSMLMLHFFKVLKLNFGVAHCNFQLRGEEANKDEAFVRAFCEINSIKFHQTTFKTEEYATEHGISIQMAARDLRYAWFETIRTTHNYHYIATAHHKNDVAETMLINLTKGTGIAGLHGIKPKQHKIIRPLLGFTSKEINTYCIDNKIEFREDVSNANTKYTRNAIRHNVISELEKINPNFIETANIEAKQFLELEEILLQKIEEEKNKIFFKETKGFKIEIEALKKLTPLPTYLYYFLKDYNFNKDDVIDIFEGLDGQSGKIYNSKTHQILKDRSFLFLTKIEALTTEKIRLNSLEDVPFEYEIVKDLEHLEILKNNNIAYLDADKISFPIVLRKWENGDVFKPLGMNGSKKVSDFLIDNKISLTEKSSVKVLVSNNEIIWLVGYRISDKFKVSSTTQQVLIFKL